MNKSTQITIIGPGKVGNALKKALLDSGYSSPTMVGREEDITGKGDWVFITTRDDQINDAIERLEGTPLDGKYVIHCSGTIGSDILADVKNRGAYTACFHPNQSVTSETSSFRGTWFDIEGDEKALCLLEEIAREFKANTIRVNPEQKKKLHISAVIASNYLVTLTKIANLVSAKAGLDENRIQELLLPLMDSVLNNLKDLTPEEALTGPIQRGDVRTIREHINLLKDNEELLSIYQNLGLRTVDLSDHGENKKKALKDALK